MLRSALLPKISVAADELSFSPLKSLSALLKATLVMNVLGATAESTLTTKVKLTVPTTTVALVHCTWPPDPTAGVVQLQPAADVKETNVVPAGSESLSTAFSAGSGPRF